jgi:HEPN domain-containing protein
MDFTAEHYFRAALERITQARYLYEKGDSYALAMYAAGVAVECLLRAYRLKVDPSFESRHDLLLLLKESRMLGMGQDRLKARGMSAQEIEQHTKALRSALNQVFTLWHNNYRYASEDRLRSYLKRQKRYEGIKGDPLKGNALQLLHAAQVFITKGVLQWR